MFVDQGAIEVERDAGRPGGRGHTARAGQGVLPATVSGALHAGADQHVDKLGGELFLDVRAGEKGSPRRAAVSIR